MRHRLVLLVSAGWLVGMTPAARAQLSFDARRTGMGGVSLGRDGALGRFNPAYQAVPARQGRNAKFTIPIPLG
ncbi:MAG TPA: hypothetical protein VGQ25_11255, partial [Gemmatimonadales bacterium]|nr:hypothetical protein [Gemmatimonadales bacterium]